MKNYMADGILRSVGYSRDRYMYNVRKQDLVGQLGRDHNHERNGVTTGAETENK